MGRLSGFEVLHATTPNKVRRRHSPERPLDDTYSSTLLSEDDTGRLSFDCDHMLTPLGLPQPRPSPAQRPRAKFCPPLKIMLEGVEMAVGTRIFYSITIYFFHRGKSTMIYDLIFRRFTDEGDEQRALIEMHGLYYLSQPMRISPTTAKYKPPPPDVGGSTLPTSTPISSCVSGLGQLGQLQAQAQQAPSVTTASVGCPMQAQQQPQAQQSQQPGQPQQDPTATQWHHYTQAGAIFGSLIGPNGKQLTSTDPYNTTVFRGGLTACGGDMLRTFFGRLGRFNKAAQAVAQAAQVAALQAAAATPPPVPAPLPVVLPQQQPQQPQVQPATAATNSNNGWRLGLPVLVDPFPVVV
ncbi:hypothetical protein B0H16DRAFT_1813232 [Mycena metata]|uniref:Uncharacterized protein n=1 Tax=Mycena metata TaxID=1033252 RepID=A0AAD7H5H0_9AGAR|nr:hypothetical protein B0H16DRAFT_1813232 [Mycena metata]